MLYFNEFWWYVSRCIHHYSPGVIASPTEIYNFMVFITNFLCLHNFWCVMHYCLLCNASLVVKSICQRQRNGPKSKLQSALYLRNSHFWNSKQCNVLANFAIEIIFAFNKEGGLCFIHPIFGFWSLLAKKLRKYENIV